MNTNFWKISTVTLAVLASFLLWKLCTIKTMNINGFNANLKLKSDTVIINTIDTVRYTEIVPKTVENVRVDTICKTFAVNDTIYKQIEVEIPIERVTYTDTLYSCTVEGYKPKLLDIEIYNHTTEKTVTNTVTKWKSGIKVVPNIGFGYGVINHKPDVYVGVGIGYVF